LWSLDILWVQSVHCLTVSCSFSMNVSMSSFMISSLRNFYECHWAPWSHLSSFCWG
jgi:hypothetical protein